MRWTAILILLDIISDMEDSIWVNRRWNIENHDAFGVECQLPGLILVLPLKQGSESWIPPWGPPPLSGGFLLVTSLLSSSLSEASYAPYPGCVTPFHWLSPTTCDLWPWKFKTELVRILVCLIPTHLFLVRHTGCLKSCPWTPRISRFPCLIS